MNWALPKHSSADPRMVLKKIAANIQIFFLIVNNFFEVNFCPHREQIELGRIQ